MFGLNNQYNWFSQLQFAPQLSHLSHLTESIYRISQENKNMISLKSYYVKFTKYIIETETVEASKISCAIQPISKKKTQICESLSKSYEA